MIGIYKFTNKYNRKVYIGKAVDINKRYNQHIRGAFTDFDECIFHRALRKYGIEGFDYEVIHECPEKQLNYWETFYIRYYNSNACKGGYGYNMTDGGDGRNGYKASDEERYKISVGNKGKHRTPEQIANNTGIWKEGHEPWNKGMKMSDEFKIKVGKSSKGRTAWNKGLTKETDERVRKYAETESQTKLNKKHI